MERKLKISDLSVGDWVMVEGKAVKVESLGKIRDYVELEGDLALSHIKVVQPIPLTVEILRKNTNFEEDSVHGRNRFVRYGDYYETDFTVLLFPRHHYAQFYVGSEEPAARSDFYIRCIQYVHELQHALRLARIDKEIEL